MTEYAWGPAYTANDHSESPGRPLRVLMVEDSELDAALVRQELERGGYHVIARRVQTAEAMRTALEEGAWDLVVSDYSMPQFSAPAALEVLKASGHDLPFIIVSGTIGEHTAVDALKAGAHDFLIKNQLARLLPAVEREMREVTVRQRRAKADEALRHSEAQYRSLVERAVFGIFRSTVDGRLLAVNPALLRILQYDDAQALLEVNLKELCVHPNERDALVQGALARRHVVGLELMWRTKTGVPIRVRVSGSIVEVLPSEGPIFEVIVEDVTEPHRLQEQLRQAQKMEAIGHLAGGVAHDFNNLLTAILGYSELLTEQIGPDKPIGRDLQEIRNAAQRAAALTRQLLAFSRKQVLAVTALDLNQIVGNIEPMLRRLLGERIGIQVSLTRGVRLVSADPTQLEQVVMNLSVNARDAMPDGGTLTIATCDADIHAGSSEAHAGAAPGRYALLDVRDTGAGMTEDVQARIFEPFFTTKERGRGTGLGLAAVHGIVNQLGGHIAVRSAPGKGTSFQIYLPATDRPLAPSAVSEIVSSAVGRETILVVEDEDGVRSFIAVVLRRFGYHVLEASSAESALRALGDRTGTVSLLLTDVVLPKMDGRTLAAELTRERPELQVLFMSGHSEQVRSEAGFLEPGLQLLEKPFTAKALLSKVRSALTPQNG